MTHGLRLGRRYYSESYVEKLLALQPLARAALRKMDRSLPVELPPLEKKQCRRCKEFWPATDEFFYRNPDNGRLRSPCKACIQEKRAETNAVKPCGFNGCDKPRYSPHHSYCWDHRDTRHRQEANHDAALL